MPLVPIHSFAKVKPSSADLKGGTAASQTITGWDAEKGVVVIGSSVEGAEGKERIFDHFERTIPPDESQSRTYELVCAPLVNQWLSGYDVDVICYGQTGSGKTYTQFGPPQSMKKAKDSLGEKGGIGSICGDDVMRDEYGFILRAGFDALQSVAKINDGSSKSKALLFGSMVELSLLCVSAQNASDLLNGKRQCFVDKYNHLEGAAHIPLVDSRALVDMAAAVESRLARGTNMNNSSSRSHCITVFTLYVRDDQGNVRASRFNFFDFMGSERFSGSNSAHDTSKSAHGTEAGGEGIFANFSLLYLGEACRTSIRERKKKSSSKNGFPPVGGSFLNMLLAGSLVGNAVTAMITCLSPSKRNGSESLHSCKFSKDVARMRNNPQLQPSVPHATLVKEIQEEYGKILKIVEKGVVGKYQKKREAQIQGFENTLRILQELGDGDERKGLSDSTRAEPKPRRERSEKQIATFAQAHEARMKKFAEMKEQQC